MSRRGRFEACEILVLANEKRARLCVKPVPTWVTRAASRA
jgi:hypothetical protein